MCLIYNSIKITFLVFSRYSFELRKNNIFFWKIPFSHYISFFKLKSSKSLSIPLDLPAIKDVTHICAEGSNRTLKVRVEQHSQCAKVTVHGLL